MIATLRGVRIIPVVVASLLIGAPHARGDDWAFVGSDHEQLKGFAIAAVGSVIEESKYDPVTSERLRWFEFHESYGTRFCFRVRSLGNTGTGEKAALLLVDNNDQVRVAILDSYVGSIKVDMLQPERIQCPSQ
jgi:hypothetical protein